MINSQKQLNEFYVTYRKQVLKVLYQYCVFWSVHQQRWLPWSLVGWVIFDCSATTGRVLTKLDGNQVLKTLYQVRVFELTRWPPWSLNAYHIFTSFLLRSATNERIWTKFDRKQVSISMSSTNFVFLGRLSTKMAAMASYSLKHFRLLICIRWSVNGSKYSTSPRKFVFSSNPLINYKGCMWLTVLRCTMWICPWASWFLNECYTWDEKFGKWTCLEVMQIKFNFCPILHELLPFLQL